MRSKDFCARTRVKNAAERDPEMHALSGTAESGEEHIVAGSNLKLKNLKYRFAKN